MYDIDTHGGRVKEAILAAGIALWRDHGHAAASARKIGKTVGLTHSAVLYHFGSAALLRDAIAHRAVHQQDDVIVPQLIGLRHGAVQCLSDADRQRYMRGV